MTQQKSSPRSIKEPHLNKKDLFKTMEYNSGDDKLKYPIDISNNQTATKTRKILPYRDSKDIERLKKPQSNSKKLTRTTYDQLTETLSKVLSSRLSEMTKHEKPSAKKKKVNIRESVNISKSNNKHGHKKYLSIGTSDTKSGNTTTEKKNTLTEKLNGLKIRLKSLLEVDPEFVVIVKKTLNKSIIE